MTTNTLLVEVFTEELPPKALSRLGQAFAEGVFAGLRSRELLVPDSRYRWFATPRRLAVLISAVASQAPDAEKIDKLMPATVGRKPDGAASEPLRKKLRALGREALADGWPDCWDGSDHLYVAAEGKAEYVFLRTLAKGAALLTGLEAALADAVESLPIPKVMRYQSEEGADVEFVRPAHALVALHGPEIVPVALLGLHAGRTTHGHRFQGAKQIMLADADEYEAKLREEGGVIASFAARREAIQAQLTDKARALGADPRLAERDALLDEVTALVEMPTVYVGEFEPDFLSVPQECLILTMQANQKYFPLFDRDGRLLNKFLIVSNMHLDEPGNIIEGNQRVVRPRLADARFFYEQDKKVKLADRVPQLKSIVYHNKLGSLFQRAERLQLLAAQIARLLLEEGIPADEGQAARSAYLSKADLTTNMVGEFPELQGIMGTYYARHDGEDEAVALAIEGHYHPRFAGDTLPSNMPGACLALADRLDTLVGIFGVGQAPTGDKDPFALRRAALGVLRILLELKLPLDLRYEINRAGMTLNNQYAGNIESSQATFWRPASPPILDQVYEFLIERLRNYLREKGFDPEVVDAVLSQNPTRIDLVLPRIEAVRAFRKLPEAEALAAANKRTRNILKKADGLRDSCDPALFAEGAEKQLHDSVTKLAPEVGSRVAAQDYTAALKQLAGIRGDVDKFFDDVLVMADDPKVRANRLALLSQLEKLLNQVADISKLAT